MGKQLKGVDIYIYTHIYTGKERAPLNSTAKYHGLELITSGTDKRELRRLVNIPRATYFSRKNILPHRSILVADQDPTLGSTRSTYVSNVPVQLFVARRLREDHG